MDSLLKKVNLDLKMRMYGVLATRQKVGIMEFVDESMPVRQRYRNIFSQAGSRSVD